MRAMPAPAAHTKQLLLLLLRMPCLEDEEDARGNAAAVASYFWPAPRRPHSIALRAAPHNRYYNYDYSLFGSIIIAA